MYMYVCACMYVSVGRCACLCTCVLMEVWCVLSKNIIIIKRKEEKKKRSTKSVNDVPNNSASEHPLITQPMLSSIPLSGEVLSRKPSSSDVSTTVRSMESDPRFPVRFNRTPDSLVVWEVWEVSERWGSGGTMDPSTSTFWLVLWKNNDLNTFVVDRWPSSCEECSWDTCFEPKNLLLPALFKPDLRDSLTTFNLTL